MGLTTCPDCQAQVSDIAPTCPQCGRPLLASPKPPKPSPPGPTCYACDALATTKCQRCGTVSCLQHVKAVGKVLCSNCIQWYKGQRQLESGCALIILLLAAVMAAVALACCHYSLHLGAETAEKICSTVRKSLARQGCNWVRTWEASPYTSHSVSHRCDGDDYCAGTPKRHHRIAITGRDGHSYP